MSKQIFHRKLHIGAGIDQHGQIAITIDGLEDTALTEDAALALSSQLIAAVLQGRQLPEYKPVVLPVDMVETGSSFPPDEAE